MNNNINNNHNVLQIINDNNNKITPPIVDVKIIKSVAKIDPGEIKIQCVFLEGPY